MRKKLDTISGSYRIRKTYKGKAYTVIFAHKPTQKEAMQAMASELDKVKEKHNSLTFRAAAEEYIASKRNVLSPSTIRGYTGILHQLPEDFLNENVHDITALDVQKEISRLSKNRSPKTTRNYHGLISAILSIFCPNLKLTTTLPQRIKNKPYIPSDEDVRIILAYARETEYEVPLRKH